MKNSAAVDGVVTIFTTPNISRRNICRGVAWSVVMRRLSRTQPTGFPAHD
jgi:hypothetical protein